MSSNNHNNDRWGGNRKKDGPPDLDKLLKDLLGKFIKRSSANKQQDSFGQNNSPNAVAIHPKNFFIILGSVLLGVVMLWFLSGIYTVGPAEQAVILQLGKYYQTENSGLHWFPRLIESKYILDTQKVSAYQYDSDMLTKDENIVNVSLVVQYRIANPKDYLFNVINPEESLEQATASALRQVVGDSSLDGVLTSQRALLRQNVEVLLKQILALYNTGLEVTDVELQPTKPPEEVTAAFDDAIKAREDEQRYINKANAYKMSIVPLAQGQANRILQQGEAYKQKVVLQAEGDVARFSALLPIYEKMPQVTQSRIYLDTIESVLQNNNKIFVDTPNANLLYLPLNQWFNKTLNGVNVTSLKQQNIANHSTDVISKAEAAAQQNNRDAYSEQEISYDN